MTRGPQNEAAKGKLHLTACDDNCEADAKSIIYAYITSCHAANHKVHV